MLTRRGGRPLNDRWVVVRRGSMGLLLAFMVVLGTAIGASALGESGTKYCNPSFTKIKSLTYESTEHRAGPPGGATSQIAYWFGQPYWTYHYSHTGRHDASWTVWTNYAINYSDTYAYCVSYG